MKHFTLKTLEPVPVPTPDYEPVVGYPTPEQVEELADTNYRVCNLAWDAWHKNYSVMLWTQVTGDPFVSIDGLSAAQVASLMLVLGRDAEGAK